MHRDDFTFNFWVATIKSTGSYCYNTFTVIQDFYAKVRSKSYSVEKFIEITARNTFSTKNANGAMREFSRAKILTL